MSVGMNLCVMCMLCCSEAEREACDGSASLEGARVGFNSTRSPDGATVSHQVSLAL